MVPHGYVLFEKGSNGGQGFRDKGEHSSHGRLGMCHGVPLGISCKRTTLAMGSRLISALCANYHIGSGAGVWRIGQSHRPIGGIRSSYP